MASKGKRQSMPAWSQRVQGRNGPLAFPSPDVSDVTLPGLPAGLLPRGALDSGIAVTVPDWGQYPPDGDYEMIWLQMARLGSDEYQMVAEFIYTQGTSPVPPFPITIPSDFLLKEENEGAFNVRFEHENFLGTPALSDPVPVFIDKTPPNGTAYPDKIIFTPPPPFTDASLDGLSDVEGTIPVWTGAADGDQVAFTWMKDRLPEDPASIVPIDVVTLGADRKVRFPVALIRSMGDGGFCGGYVILDKAGNESRISLYDLVPVALGTFPPMPYPPLSVPEVGVKGYVDRMDALQGVHVEFPRILQAKDTDEIAIIWGGQELAYRTPVGSLPGSTMSVGVNWEHMRDQYAAASGPVSTTVEYKLYRGILELGGMTGTVMVDFSMTGPGNPDPGPGNPALFPLDVYGDSDVPNVLIAADRSEPVYARIELYSPLADDDEIQVLWNRKPIGSPYIINTAADTAGDLIEIDLDWTVIEREGNNPKMPVTYTLTNPDHNNPQEPEELTEVEILFLTVDLPVAEPQNLIRDRLTCLSLVVEGGKTGVQYQIPPSDYLKAGMTVEVEWKAYSTYAAPVPLPDAGKIATLGPISPQEEIEGVFWLIEPYDVHLLPTWGGPLDQIGKGEVIYTLKVGGVDVSSPPSDTEVALSAGAGTCVLP